MIRVAAGEPLAFTQAQIRRDGWAIECRINAEDPQRGFLPSTGRLVAFQPPAQTHVRRRAGAEDAGVRVDTGVYEGGEIPIYYDSMICKLIAVRHAIATPRSRRCAMRSTASWCAACSSNIAFQAALLAHPRFVAGDFNTGFIAEEYPHGFDASRAPQADPRLAARARGRHQPAPARPLGRASAGSCRDTSCGSARTSSSSRSTPTGSAARRRRACASEGADYLVTIAGRTLRLSLASALRDIATSGSVDGRPFNAQVERVGLAYRVAQGGAQVEVRVLSPRAAELHALMPFKPPPDLSRFLLSPMPGLLVDVAVKAGQAVRAGERLAVIEAMKMENILVAAHDGVVARVVAERGDEPGGRRGDPRVRTRRGGA